MEPILKIKNLKKNYHDMKDEIMAIENVEFTVYPHEFISIVGPSGCGKSTLLSILSGLDQKSDGTITFQQQNPKN